MASTTRNPGRPLLRRGIVAAIGLALAGAAIPTATAAGGPPLGAARTFAALGGSTLSSTGATAIVGDVGVSPGTAITGFPPGTVTGGAIHAGDVEAAQAHSDAALAYDFLAGMASLPANNLSDTDLGGVTLAPGVYKFNTSAQLTGDLTLDAQGDSGALFVIQIGTTLTTSSNSSVTVINGGADYDEANVFWQVGSSATLGSGTDFVGNILAYSSITIVSGSSMNGNALALNGAVTMDGNFVTSSSVGGAAPAPGPTPPGNLIAAPTNLETCTGTELTWTDASNNETEFRVFRRDGAGPGFAQVGTVLSTDTVGTGAVVTFQDLVLDPSTTYTYQVTAYSTVDGASAPSNESLVETCDVVPDPTGARWLDVHLGRRRSVIRDRRHARQDRVVVKGSFAVIDVETSVPTVLHDADPRPLGVAIQVRAPGSLVLLTIAPNDPRWKASKRGVYRWRTRAGRRAPLSRIRIDTRKSEFALRSSRNDFGVSPVNSITVSLTYQGVTGSDSRAWNQPTKRARGTRTVFTLPR